MLALTTVAIFSTGLYSFWFGIIYYIFYPDSLKLQLGLTIHEEELRVLRGLS